MIVDDSALFAARSRARMQSAVVMRLRELWGFCVSTSEIFMSFFPVFDGRSTVKETNIWRLKGRFRKTKVSRSKIFVWWRNSVDYFPEVFWLLWEQLQFSWTAHKVIIFPWPISLHFPPWAQYIRVYDTGVYLWYFRPCGLNSLLFCVLIDCFICHSLKGINNRKNPFIDYEILLLAIALWLSNWLCHLRQHCVLFTQSCCLNKSRLEPIRLHNI